MNIEEIWELDNSFSDNNETVDLLDEEIESYEELNALNAYWI